MASGDDRSKHHASGREHQQQRHADGAPGEPPALRQHHGADEGKGDHEADAHHERVNRHGLREPLPEPLADHGQADDRERALTEAARQRHEHEQRGKSHRLAHRHDDAPSSSASDRQHAAAPVAIEQPADAEAAERADQGGDQVDLRVGDAAEAEIAQQRLGDEPEALRPSGQRPDHGERGHAQHDPAVVDTDARDGKRVDTATDMRVGSYDADVTLVTVRPCRPRWVAPRAAGPDRRAA